MRTERLSEKQIRYLHCYLPEHLYELQKGHSEDRRLQKLVFDARFQDDGLRLIGTAEFLFKALLLVARISSDNHRYFDLARCVVVYHRRRQKWFSEVLVGLQRDPHLVLALASSLTNSTSTLGLIVAAVLISIQDRNHVAISSLLASISSVPIEEHDEDMGRLLGVVAVKLSLLGYSSRELLSREKLPVKRVRWFLEAVDCEVSTEYAGGRGVLLGSCRELLEDIADATHRAMARKEIGARLGILTSVDAFQETKLLVTEAFADKEPVLQLSCLYSGARPFPALAQLILSEINENLQSLLHRAERSPITDDAAFEWYVTGRALLQPETAMGNEYWQQEVIFFRLSQSCLVLIGDVNETLQSKMCRLLRKQFAEQPADSLNRAHGYMLLAKALVDGKTRSEGVKDLLDLAEAELEQSAGPQTRSELPRGFGMGRGASLPSPSVWFVCRAWATVGSLRTVLGQGDRAERAHRRAAERLKSLEAELPNALIEAAIARVTCTVLRARSDIHAVETELVDIAQKLPTNLWACCAMTHYADLRHQGLQLLDAWLGKEPTEKSEEDTPRGLLLELLERCLPQGRHGIMSDPHALEEFTFHPAAVGDVAMMMMRGAFFVKNDDQRADFVRRALEALGGDGALHLDSEQLQTCVDGIGTFVSPQKKAAAVRAFSYALAVSRRSCDSIVQRLETVAKDCGGTSDTALRGLAANAASFQHHDEAARLLVLSAYFRFREDAAWSEDELLAELCVRGEPGLASNIAETINSHARTCRLSPSAVTRIARAVSRLSRSSQASSGNTTLGILLSRAEELVSTEQRILVLENLARDLRGSESASNSAIVACRALWASMASDTAEAKVDVAIRIGRLLLDSGHATEAMGAITFGIDACFESPWEERAKHLLDLYWLGNEYRLAVGKELLSAALTCLEHGRDHARMTDVLNLLTIAIPGLCNPTEDWYKEFVSRVFKLSQRLGESYHFWMQARYRQGEVAMIEWGASAETQCEKLLAWEERVLSLHSTDSDDDFASATNLCSASRIVQRNASEPWTQSMAQRILRLVDRITDTHRDSRSEMIANSASVLAYTDPAAAMPFLKDISVPKHRTQLLEAISDGSSKVRDHAVCFETVYLALQDEAVAVRSVANLAGIIDDKAALGNVLSFLLDVNLSSNDELAGTFESTQPDETFFQRYLALFEPQRRFFLGLADRFPRALVEVGEDKTRRSAEA